MKTPLEFCYWLNGHFDLNPSNELTEEQVRCIREHLQQVFNQQIELVKECPLKEKEDPELPVDIPEQIKPEWPPYLPFAPYPNYPFNPFYTEWPEPGKITWDCNKPIC